VNKAVAADEVPQLAGRATTATAEVEGAIHPMCKETIQAVSMMEKGGVKVEQGLI